MISFGDLDLIFKVIVLYVIKTSRCLFLNCIYRDKLKSCIEFDDLDPISMVERDFSNGYRYIS